MGGGVWHHAATEAHEVFVRFRPRVFPDRRRLSHAPRACADAFPETELFARGSTRGRKRRLCTATGLLRS